MPRSGISLQLGFSASVAKLAAFLRIRFYFFLNLRIFLKTCGPDWLFLGLFFANLCFADCLFSKLYRTFTGSIYSKTQSGCSCINLLILALFSLICLLVFVLVYFLIFCFVQYSYKTHF